MGNATLSRRAAGDAIASRCAWLVECQWAAAPTEPDLRKILEDAGLLHRASQLGRKGYTLQNLARDGSDDGLRKEGLAPRDRRHLLNVLPPLPPSKYLQACFEFAVHFVTYTNLEWNPDMECELERRVCFPQYILVGDQSAGKTSVLCRLAKLPLGFVSSQTGTRRPFEFTFIHDESAPHPQIEVDGKSVDHGDLFDKLKMLNDVDGFVEDGVSVKIRWCNLSNLAVTDMPGLKDRDEGPERLLLARLADPGVTPVLILENRDMEQKHAVYELLEKADPPRKRSDIIVLQNKCDQLICERGNWRCAETWRGHFEGTQKRGFKAIFFSGKPAALPDSTEGEELLRCWVREATMFREWGVEVGHNPQHELSMGIKRFAECIAKDQMERAEAFARENGPDVQSLLDGVALRRIKAYQEQNTLIDRVMRVLCKMTGWMKEALRGEVDVHGIDEGHRGDIQSDLEWLLNNFVASPHQSKAYEKDAKHLVQGLESLQNTSTLIQSLGTSTEKGYNLFGGAAVERSAPLLTVWCCLNAWSDLKLCMTPEWVQNVLGEGVVRDSGNKVIREFMRRLMAQTVHPLIEVVFCLICQQMKRVVEAVLVHPEGGYEWSESFCCLVPLCDRVKEDVRRSAFDFITDVVMGVKNELHRHVENTSRSLDLNVALGTNAQLATRLSTNTAGLDKLFRGARRERSEDWQQAHMQDLVLKHKTDEGNSTIKCIQRAYGSDLEKASNNSGELSSPSTSLSPSVATGLPLDFPSIWKHAAEVAHVRIITLSDTFHAYVQKAQRDVQDGLEQHVQKDIAVKRADKYRAEWQKHQRRDTERLCRMEAALQRAHDVYRERVASG